MVLPVIIGLIRVGTIVYKVARTPAAQAMAKRLLNGGFGKQVQSAGTKKLQNLTANKTAKIIAEKTPGTATKIGSALKLKGKKVTTGSAGAEKGSIVVGSARTGANKLGNKVIGGGVVAIPAGAGIAYLKNKLNNADDAVKEADSKTAKAKARADKEIITAALAKAMLEDKKSSAPPKSIKPKSRPTKKPTAKDRPRARPTNLNMGGMAKAKPRTVSTDYRMGGMFMKNGNK
tara:strand:+ start:40 stop:735 length:696 start_codon:yes stop_codon:yes gene_type:complete